MHEIFSTREVATLIYSAVLVFFVFYSDKTRSSAVRVLKSGIKLKLLSPFLLLFAYTALVAYILNVFYILNIQNIKNIFIWFIFVGTPMCYGTLNVRISNDYFKGLIFKKLKLVIFVEFLISTFTFGLATELIILPLAAIIMALSEMAKSKDEFRHAAVFLDGLIAVLSIFFLYFTIEVAVLEYKESNNMQYLVSFLTPIVFTLLYIPAAYLLALYGAYENVFCVMKIYTNGDKKLLRKQKLTTIWHCNLSYSKIYDFLDRYRKYYYIGAPDEAFDRALHGSCFK